MIPLALIFVISVADAGFDFSHLDCATASSTPELNECARRDHEKVEASLNEVYKRTLAALIDDPDAIEAKKGLIAAQREWVKFRELDCRGRFTLHQSGTIRTLVYFGCMDGHAKARIAQLERWAEL
jgi:uncharacterized protein YecT (DUF1311 family)